MAINNNINCDNKEYYFGGGLRNKDSIKRNCCNSCPNSKNQDGVKHYQWWEVGDNFPRKQVTSPHQY